MNKTLLVDITRIFLLLTLGLLSYWLVRPNILLFDWLNIQKDFSFQLDNTFIFIIAKNYLADAFWCIAICFTFRLLQKHHLPNIYNRLLLTLPFASEILQATSLIQGTFDPLDLLLYLTIYLFFLNTGTLHMKKITKHLVGIFTLSTFTLAIIGSGSPPKRTYTPPVYKTGTFTIAQKPDDIFTKPSLNTILKKSKKLAIVLRVPSSGKNVTSEQKQRNNHLYNTIEKEFAKAGYIVRDRALFAKVLDQESLDYSKIGNLTKTDLILELVSFKNQSYPVKEYVDENGVQQVSEKAITFTGANIEFKVTSVEHNDLIASYVFNYTPCTKGCKHTFSTSVSSTLKGPQSTPADLFKKWSLRLIKELKMETKK